MTILGFTLMVVSLIGVNAAWSKYEWRIPIFEIQRRLEINTNPKMAEFSAEIQKRITTNSFLLFMVYLVGAGILYWKHSHLWILIIITLLGLLLLKGVLGLFRATYSPNVRLLNYLYSPHLIAWRRDHWADYTDEEIAGAIGTSVGIDPTTITVHEVNLETFLLELCEKTRPRHEVERYPEILKDLHDRASRMVWS